MAKVQMPVSMAVVPYVQKKTRKNKPRKRTTGRLSGTPVDHAYLRAIVTPFAAEAAGAKVPDSYSFPTSTTVSKTSGNFTPTSTGGQYGLWLFSPFEEVSVVNPGSITTGGLASWTGANASGSAINGSLPVIAKQYRAVGGGMRITTNTSLTSATGYIWVVHIPLLAGGTLFDTGNFPVNEAQVAQYPLSEKYTFAEMAERPLVIPFRRVSDMSYQWRVSGASGTLAANGGYNIDTGWCGIFIWANTGSITSGTTFNGERINHLEYIPDATGSTFFGFGDAVAEPLDRLVLDSAVNVGQCVPVCYAEANDQDENNLFGRVVSAAGKMVGLVANSQAGRRALSLATHAVTSRASRAITSFIGAQEEMKYIEY